MPAPGGGILEELASRLLMDLLGFVPKLMLAVIVILLAFLVMRFIGGALRKLLGLAKIDELIAQYLRIRLPISVNSIIMAIFYVGALIAAVYGLITIFLGEAYVETANSILIYGARLISVVLLTVALFAAFSSMIERIHVESRMKGYLFFVVMLLLTAILIDLTALSEPVKQALYTGLAIGIGASLTVFSIWFFFHEYLEKVAERPERGRSRQRPPPAA